MLFMEENSIHQCAISTTNLLQVLWFMYRRDIMNTNQVLSFHLHSVFASYCEIKATFHRSLRCCQTAIACWLHALAMAYQWPAQWPFRHSTVMVFNTSWKLELMKSPFVLYRVIGSWVQSAVWTGPPVLMKWLCFGAFHLTPTLVYFEPDQ